MSEPTFLEGQKEAWEEVDSIVLECQDTNTPAIRRDELLEELLIRFEPFLNMFKDLLLHDKTYLNNKVSRDFIGLYIADTGLRYKVFQNKRLTKDEFNEVNRSLSLIRDNYGKQANVENDLQAIFTQMVMKYKKTNRSFNTYISYVFRYELFRFIKAHLKDRLNNNYDRSSFEDRVIGTYNVHHSLDLSDQIIITNNDSFSDSWKKGICCSDIFSELTEEERTIISMLFYELLKPAEIQEKLHMNVNTYRRIRRTALEKLEKATGLTTKHLKKHRASN